MVLNHGIMNFLALPIFVTLLLCVLLPFLLFKIFHFIIRSMRSENVAGKVILITGASFGIGEHLAYEYGRRGARLALVARRENRLKEVANRAKSLGSPDVITIPADVSIVQDCKRFVDLTVNHFGRLDHLVNNAGIERSARVEDWHEFSELTPVIDTNFWGTVYGTFYAIPHLKNSKGKIIVIASSAAWCPLPRLSIYNASKAAVVNFFETLRIELGRSIGITIATPGVIKTDMTLRVMNELPSCYGRRFPMASASKCAKAIVKSACRGDMYVTYPSWMKAWIAWILLFPGVMDWTIGWLCGLSPNNSTNKAHLHLSMNLQNKIE